MPEEEQNFFITEDIRPEEPDNAIQEENESDLDHQQPKDQPLPAEEDDEEFDSQLQAMLDGAGKSVGSASQAGAQKLLDARGQERRRWQQERGWRRRWRGGERQWRRQPPPPDREREGAGGSAERRSGSTEGWDHRPRLPMGGLVPVPPIPHSEENDFQSGT